MQSKVKQVFMQMLKQSKYIFPEQIDLKTDTVTFSLLGVNEEAITVSAKC